MLWVAVMVGAAGLVGERAVIFPEGAALAFGIGTLALPAWTASAWRVVVLIMSLSIGAWLRRRPTRPSRPTRPAPAGPTRPSGRLPWAAVLAGGGVVASWIAIGGGLAGLAAPAFAPPMFVSVIEWIGRPSPTIRSGLVRWLELVVAAGLGVAAVHLIPSAWLGATVAVALTLVLLAVLHEVNPPALAVAVIPQLARGLPAGRFMLAVAAGASALYLLAWIVRHALDAGALRPTRADGAPGAAAWSPLGRRRARRAGQPTRGSSSRGSEASDPR